MHSIGFVLAAFGAGFVTFCIVQIMLRLHYLYPNVFLFKVMMIVSLIFLYIFPLSLIVMGAFYLFERWSKDNAQKQDLLDIQQQKEKYEAYRRGEYQPTYEELQNWSEPF